MLKEVDLIDLKTLTFFSAPEPLHGRSKLRKGKAAIGDGEACHEQRTETSITVELCT
jgi:hypothetical protein